MHHLKRNTAKSMYGSSCIEYRPHVKPVIIEVQVNIGCSGEGVLVDQLSQIVGIHDVR